jgi:uncharacterized protein with PIN domain
MNRVSTADRFTVEATLFMERIIVMFSTRCQSCRQLINLKTEEVRTAVTEAEAKKEKIYTMHCPKCGKLVKVQIKEMKRKLPVAPTPDESTAS